MAEKLRKLAVEFHRMVAADKRALRAVWYSSAGTMAWMEVAGGHVLYGALIAILSVHYENMPQGK